MILVFFGPPGSGKGTQAKFISTTFNIPHLSTGEILRNSLKEKTNLSLQLKKIIDSGGLVSDDILNQIITDRISQKDCKKGFIFDGYPRTLSQAYFINGYFLENNLKVKFFFEFKIDNQIISKRISKRAIEEGRNDDNIEIIQNRLNEYKEETLPVLAYYEKEYKSIYLKIEGSQEITKINSLLLDFLKKD
tara:strand:+ start:107 stop:679 length:573 start_codon:yes stop_codon:yes gene_type:complete